MAYAGGIGQEIDQLKDLSVQELVRRQNLDPSLIYTIALQERQKMDAAGARQGVLDEPKPEGTVTSRMEQELAQQTMPQAPVNRVAPGIQQQGQRSMQQQGPQGISGVPANNMGAVGRARGGIIGYADGGDVDPTLYDEMGKQYLPGQPLPEGWQTLTNAPRKIQLPFNPAGEEFAGELREMERTRRERGDRTFLEALRDSDLHPTAGDYMKDVGARRRFTEKNPNFASKLEAGKESRERVLDAQSEAFQARLKELNEAKANAFPQEKAMFQQQIQDLLDNTPAPIRNAVGGAGMAFGGVVGERDRAIDMDALLDALMMAESGGDPNAVSRAGAEGLYQIMPSTGRQPGFGVEPLGDAFDPQESRRFARDYLQAMLDRYDGDVEAALIAYNAGFGNADKFIAADRNLSALPRRDETEPYVRKIMGQLEKEDRRRDLQMGGGRTISTTADESYTEKRRRERLGRQEAGLASLYPPVAMEEAEMYKPNLPDALTVMQAMESLRDGKEETPVIAGFPTREETDKAFTDAGLSGYGDGSRIRQRGRTGPEEEKLPQFDERSPQIASFPESPNAGIAGYLKNIGRQQQQRRDDFREAVPGAEAAVARAKQEKEDGGIGYLRRLGRLQEGAAQRQAEEEERAAQFMAMLRANQNKSEVEPVRPFVNESFKNGGGVKRFNGEEDGSLVEDPNFLTRNLNRLKPKQELIDNMQEEEWWLKEGTPVDMGMSPSEFIEPFKDDPVSTAAAYLLSAWGVTKFLKLGAPALKTLQQRVGPSVMQKAKELALRATTKPNPAATGPVRPPFRPPAGRVVDPVKIGVGTLAAITAEDAIYGGDGDQPTNPVEYLQDIGRKQEEAGTIEAFRAKRRAEEEERRRNPPVKTGISGALDKAKPLGSLALKLAEVLGRGGGASEGFEFAKINEESSRLRSEEAKMQLGRDQIAATTGQSAARSAATSNTALMKLIVDYQNDPAYITALAAKAEEMNLDKTDSRVAQAVMEAYIANLKNVQGMLGGGIGSMQGLGGGGGLPEGVTVKRVN